MSGAGGAWLRLEGKEGVVEGSGEEERRKEWWDEHDEAGRRREAMEVGVLQF